MAKIATRWLTLEIDECSGAITGLRSLPGGPEMIASSSGAIPFRLHYEGSVATPSFRFKMEALTDGEHGPSLALAWIISPRTRIDARIDADRRDDTFVFRVRVSNATRKRVVGIEYPVFGGLTALSADGAADRLAHSYATGFLVKNPMVAFTRDRPGFRYMPYPEGFSGCTAQLLAYYTEGGGGFSLSTHDGEFRGKWLNFYKADDGLLEATVIHGAEAVEPMAGVDAWYPTVLRPLSDGTWYEAAEHYKRWAATQIWCAGGPLAHQSDTERPIRFLETVGAATFGIDARYDRAAWIERYQESIETPMLHVLGPDWPKVPGYYGGRGLPGEIEDWFPARFDPHNMRAIRSHGDLCTPFEFDFLFPPEKAPRESNPRLAYQRFPRVKRSIDQYRFPFLCPVEGYTRRLHVERDARLVSEQDVDGVYYDISANNILRACTNTNHAHPRGSSRALTKAYREIYAETRAEMVRRTGRYCMVGTEMINEVFLDQVDFYQARAGARPAAAFEGGPLRDLIKDGQAELIPLFAFLYHEYGAVRLDGWGKVTEEAGDLFYFTVARTYLWGGIYEINSEFSPMEAIDGRENPVEEHYAHIEPRGYEFSHDRARYIGNFAKLRTGVAQPYLVYGTMMRPIPLSVPTVDLSWFSYNCPAPWPEYNACGTLRVPQVVHSAWRSVEGNLGYLFSNVADRPCTVMLELPPASGGQGSPVQLNLHHGESLRDSRLVPDGEAVTLTLEIGPYEVQMIELITTRAAGTKGTDQAQGG